MGQVCLALNSIEFTNTICRLVFGCWSILIRLTLNSDGNIFGCWIIFLILCSNRSIQCFPFLIYSWCSYDFTIFITKTFWKISYCWIAFFDPYTCIRYTKLDICIRKWLSCCYSKSCSFSCFIIFKCFNNWWRSINGDCTYCVSITSNTIRSCSRDYICTIFNKAIWKSDYTRVLIDYHSCRSTWNRPSSIVFLCFNRSSCCRSCRCIGYADTVSGCLTCLWCNRNITILTVYITVWSCWFHLKYNRLLFVNCEGCTCFTVLVLSFCRENRLGDTSVCTWIAKCFVSIYCPSIADPFKVHTCWEEGIILDCSIIRSCQIIMSIPKSRINVSQNFVVIRKVFLDNIYHTIFHVVGRSVGSIRNIDSGCFNT